MQIYRYLANFYLYCKLHSQTRFAAAALPGAGAYLSRHTRPVFVSLNVNIAVDTTVLWTTIRAYNIILVRLYILPWELQIILRLHPALLRVSRGSTYCLNRVFYCTVSNFPGATLLLNNLQPRSAAEWRPGLHIWDTVTLTGDTGSLGRVASGAADDNR